jgi:tRNA A-37 threonylcarbamoyl transferase component Bud32
MSEAEWRELLRPLLGQAGLRSPVAAVAPLAGGVSSDIVRVQLEDRQNVCAKRALPRLKVASLWEAPLERNHYEAAWFRLAGSVAPGFAPRVLAEDQAHGIILLEYLPPDDYLLWKAELLEGRIDAGTAESVAARLACVHGATWADRSVAEAFATDAVFDAIRISPYLRSLAERTPDLAKEIMAVAEQTAATRCALVHGDVSPKNILVSRRDGHPVLLDAECAWFGDPAFDAAFCMNHLLLKAAHIPSLRSKLLDAARRFFVTWVTALPDGTQNEVERRLARLLPCLLLARIDGKSPVEYLSEAQREVVRQVSRPLISDAPSSTDELISRFATSLAQQDPQ